MRRAAHFLNNVILKSILVLTVSLFFLFPTEVQARVVTDVQITTSESGYEIHIEFFFPLRYQSHTPTEPGQELSVQLRPINFQQLTEEQLDDLRTHISLGWDESTGIPLKGIILEGGDPDHPQMTFYFSKEVAFDVHSSSDLRTLIVTLNTEVLPPPDFKQTLPEVKPPALFIPEDHALADLMEEANDFMRENDFIQAIQIYKKILETAKGTDRQRTKELLGYALEKDGQLEEAKEVYKQYLQGYPHEAEADRVTRRKQRITIALRALQIIKTTDEKLNKWSADYYGTVSEFFFRDQTTPKGSETQVNRSEFITNVNLNGRWKNNNYDLRSQAIWGYRKSLLSSVRDDDFVNLLNFEARDKDHGLFGKIGRQIRSSGGLLDLFDGAHLAYDLTPKVTINTVHGFPVDDTSVKAIDSDRKFHGVSFDFGTFKERWDFVVFLLNQENHGLTDRRAVGGEVRYYENNKSLFTSVDYDTFFNKLNIFFLNGWWVLPTKTTLSLVYDYRNSPSLTTNNAIEGQGVKELSELFSRFTKREIYQMAKDRTAISKSLSLSVTQNLKKDVQLTADVTRFEWEGTSTSGGVDGFPGTGVDLFYSLQLITYNNFKKKDVVITGINMDDTAQYYTYGMTFSIQYPVTKKLKLIPDFLIDYRDNKNSSDHRWRVRSSLRADYRFKKTIRFEAEAGPEWLTEKKASDTSSTTNLFVTVGFTITF